jgi:hypothetical protein
MAIIEFKKGSIFNKCIGVYDVCIFYGHHGMSFGLGYSIISNEFPVLKSHPRPFETGVIQLDNSRFLCCVNRNQMTDKEIEIDIIKWLEFTNDKGLNTIALTGTRDSEKYIKINEANNKEHSEQTISINQLIDNDNQRVKFIVEVISKWLKSNKSVITKILLIAMSDNYTRNFKESINV